MRRFYFILILFVLSGGCIERDSSNQTYIDSIVTKDKARRMEASLREEWDSLYLIYGDSLKYVSDILIRVEGLDTLIERQIFDSVVQLKTFIERDSYVRKESKGLRHLQLMIAARPSEKEPYYWVKVIEDNGIAYYTHFNFYVTKHPFRIRLYDTANDSVYDVR